MKVVLILNLSLALICLLHVISILNNFMNPDQPNVKYYEKKLNNIEFPLLFKLCFELSEVNDVLESLGYNGIWEFYEGRSMHNKNVYGWNGHTVAGNTLGSVEGRRLSIPKSK